MKPSCYNRPPFKTSVKIQDGWLNTYMIDASLQTEQVRIAHTKYIPDHMSKGCQQHGPMGEATLHPEDWDCAGCRWESTEDKTK